MLESKAYPTYYAFAFGEKAPKLKYIRKKADSDTSPKKKPNQATKGTRLKSKDKVAKPDKKKQPAKKKKAKGLAVLSKVLDEQQQKTSSIDEGTGTIPEVPDIPPYESESDKESWGDSKDEDDTDHDGDNDDDGESDDHDDDSDDERIKFDSDEIPSPNLTNVDQTEYEEEDIDDRVCTPSEYELTDEEKFDDEETMDDDEMTDANQGASEQQNISQESGFKQVEEDAHVILTPVIEVQKVDEHVQSSSVSSDFTSKLLDLENPSLADNKIASLMETLARHTTAIPEITSVFTITTPPLPPFFNPILQQQTPTFTTTTSTYLTMTLPQISNFASTSKFNQRVSILESEISKLRQTNQFAKAVSSYLGVVDTYLASKMKEAVNMVVQLQANKLREEAQAENQEFLNQVDSTMKTIIKDQVKAQVSKIMPKIEKYVTESLGAEKILIDKMEANKSINRSDNQKNLYNALVESYNSDKDIITSYGDVVLLKRGRDDQDKDEDPSAGSD
ncbi:hypothetical protein Tco_1548782 [Tanacetum coccineum]